MELSRRLGIMVFFAVPAIMGGGIIYHFLGSYYPVIGYEIILYLAAIACASK